MVLRPRSPNRSVFVCQPRQKRCMDCSFSHTHRRRRFLLDGTCRTLCRASHHSEYSMNEETIFHLASQKTGTERTAFLDQSCAGNPELRARLEDLLAAHESPAGFMQT